MSITIFKNSAFILMDWYIPKYQSSRLSQAISTKATSTLL